TQQEFQILLELIERGQRLYSNFLPIESNSFINSNKLIGDNPYIVEQAINDDFISYEKDLQEIKNLLEANREEYKSLRKLELQKQTTSIQNLITKIRLKETELNTILSNA